MLLLKTNISLKKAPQRVIKRKLENDIDIYYKSTRSKQYKQNYCLRKYLGKPLV